MRTPSTAKLEPHHLSDDGCIFLVDDMLSPGPWYVIDSERAAMPVSGGLVLFVLFWFGISFWITLVAPPFGLAAFAGILGAIYQSRQTKPAWKVLLGNGTGRHVRLFIPPDEWSVFSRYYK